MSFHERRIGCLESSQLESGARTRRLHNAGSGTERRYVVAVNGQGVAARLHRPALDELGCVEIRQVRYSPDANSMVVVEGEPVPSFDLTIVGSPPEVQVAHAHLALAHSRIVLCEKPFGTHAPDSAVFTNGPDTHGQLYVNYQLRFTCAYAALKRAFRRVRPERVEVVYRSGARMVLPKGHEWIRNEDSGGGVMYSVLPHVLDLLELLACGPTHDSVPATAWVGRLSPDRNAPDRVLVEYVTPVGRHVRIDIDTCVTHDAFMFRMAGTRDRCGVDLISQRTIEGSPSDVCYSNGILSSIRGGLWREGLTAMLRALFDRPQGDTNCLLPDAEWARLLHQRTGTLRTWVGAASDAA